jgi:serine/threonine-protein kinase
MAALDPSPDAARWERVQALFHAAVDLPGDEQDAYLTDACGPDAMLKSEVLALIAEDSRGTSLIDRNVADVARRVLGDPASAAPAEFFGPYRIIKVLGEGGMGVVFLGTRKDLNTLAAIKILRDAWLSPARRERFAIEQRTLAQLNHPSIARLYDANTLPDGTPWFVMEFVEGVPLTEYCRSRACTIRERLRLLRDVCDAVQHAHRQLVIHRDLKPSNILVRHDGTVKLLDFGIAKQLETVDAPVDQTRTGMRLMTPAYAAPEQIRSGRVGIFTDIYALGVVLYELLVERLPFDLDDRTPAQAEQAIVEQEPERPSVVARRMARLSGAGPHIRATSNAAWADLDVLCLTAMHKDPQRRYQTVETFVRDIDHYLAGEPLEARPDSMRYRGHKFVRRNWQPLLAVSVALTSVVGLVTFYTLRLTTARNAAVAEAARTQRIQGFMTTLFQGGDEAAGPSESLRVVTLVDRGVRDARRLDKEPTVQAELYQTLGGIYQQLGNLGRADSLLRASLDERRRVLGRNHPDVAASLVALGLLRNAQAAYDEAERLVREGLAMNRRLLGPNHPAVARATAALGRVLEDRGSYDQAIAVLQEAVRLSATDSASPDFRASLTELANTHFYAGHFATSDTLNKRILAMDRQRDGDRHPNVGDDLINLGAIQFEWGHFTDAERYYRQALAIIRPWYGDSHPETASNLTMLGRALVSQRKFDEATVILLDALAISERAYGPVHPRVASAVNELGRVAVQTGKLDEAEADFTRMADIYRSVYHDKHYYIGIALSNLAGVYDLRKDYTRAEQLFRDVLRRYDQVLAPDHQLVGIARIRLGKTLVSERRYVEAEQLLLSGLATVVKQSPTNNWVETARVELVTTYNAMGQPDKAARVRAELAAARRSAAEAVARR